MKVLFEGTLDVSYGFVYLDSGVGSWDQQIDVRAGQRNGLAGAAQPGFLLLVVGTHTGDVALRLELFKEQPPVDDRWDEIVEVSCDLRGRRLAMTGFDSWVDVRNVRQNGPHRVRYSALRFGDDRERKDDQVPLDRYLVQLWPGPMEPDAIVKQTSEHAAYWHHEAGGSGARNPTPYEQALAERADDDERQAARSAAERRFEHERHLASWGGREPSPALRRLGPARQIVVAHRDLVDAVEAMPGERQRALALAFARQACAADQDGPVDWAPALDALGRGADLPAPFADEDALRTAMFGPAPEEVLVATVVRGPAVRQPIHTGVSAAAAVRAAADPDPFTAAVGAIEAASWSAPDGDAFFARVAVLVR